MHALGGLEFQLMLTTRLQYTIKVSMSFFKKILSAVGSVVGYIEVRMIRRTVYIIRLLNKKL